MRYARHTAHGTRRKGQQHSSLGTRPNQDYAIHIHTRRRGDEAMLTEYQNAE
jgi:hypothetical protein